MKGSCGLVRSCPKENDCTSSGTDYKSTFHRGCVAYEIKYLVCLLGLKEVPVKVKNYPLK